MSFESIIEEHFPRLEQAKKVVQKSSSDTNASLKMLGEGNIKGLPRKLSDAVENLERALELLKSFSQDWPQAGMEGLFASEEYLQELTDRLNEQEVDAHRLNDVLYVYPALVRRESSALGMRIDKKLEAGVRPGVLAASLRRLQNAPSRFPVARFLTSLFRIYKALNSQNLPKCEVWTGKVVYLRDIYEMISAAPGSDYTEQEFVRDIYLLDSAGEDLIVRGHQASLVASSSTRDEKKLLSIITRDGERKLYCGIRFDPVD